LLDSVNEDAINALPNNADIIFIDSSHAYENTCKEIQLYSQKLSPGGCLVLHDSIKWPGVREAIVNVRESYYILTFATSRGNGLTVMFQKKTP